jgi:capping protein alpha
MADYDEEIPDEEKVTIASDFIKNAPPGEFNEVFSDVRRLLDNDALLKEGAAASFKEYNESQFTPVEVGDSKCLLTPFSSIGGNKYFDPRTKQQFSFDHLKKEVTGVSAWSGADDGIEEQRAVFEEAMDAYAKDHYPAGICSVYGKGDEITCCIEDHKFNPKNFWNGRWRSQWTFNTATRKATGKLRCQVHYYEDGNVQLETVKDCDEEVAASADTAMLAKKFVKVIESRERLLQDAITSNYNAMSGTTFKALRRALPVTRTKLDWNKILNYKVGKELAK